MSGVRALDSQLSAIAYAGHLSGEGRMSEMLNENNPPRFKRMCRMLRGGPGKRFPEAGPGILIPEMFDECRCIPCLSLRSQNVYRFTDVMQWIVKKSHLFLC